MRQDVGHRWLRALAVVAILIVVGCGGSEGTTGVEDAESPADTVDVSDTAEEVAADTEDTAEGTDTALTCPPEFDPCVLCKTDDDCEGAFEGLGACLQEVCSPEFDACIFEAVEEGTSCSDEDPCNGLETCALVDDEIECVAGVPLDCDDGDLCNGDEFCAAGVGCEDGALLVCDDDNVCTDDSCDPETGCVNVPAPDCGNSFCVCEISGAAGATVECPFVIVRGAASGDSPTGADFHLAWDSSVMAIQEFEDDLCYGSVCLPKTIPTCSGEGTECVWGSLFPSGHNILAVPKDLVEWTDHGTLLLFHPSNPFEVLTDAWLDNGAISGDGQLLLARMVLLEDIDAGAPACLYMNDPVFSVPTGLTLDVTVQEIADAKIIVVE